MSRRNKNRKNRYGSKPVDRYGKTVDEYRSQGTPPAPEQAYRHCDHEQDAVEFAEGLTIYAASWMDNKWRTTSGSATVEVDLGFYLDSSWADNAVMTQGDVSVPFGNKATPKVLYPWSDYGAPASMRTFATAIDWLVGLIAEGKTVETGCMGGHGRTGSLIAALVIHERDMEAKEAIAWVRRNYCHKAVESFSQENFLIRYANLLNGRPLTHGLLQRRRHTPNKARAKTTSAPTPGYGRRIDLDREVWSISKGTWVTVDPETMEEIPSKSPPLDMYNDNAEMAGRNSGDDAAALDKWLARHMPEDAPERDMTDEELWRAIEDGSEPLFDPNEYEVIDDVEYEVIDDACPYRVGWCEEDTPCEECWTDMRWEATN